MNNGSHDKSLNVGPINVFIPFSGKVSHDLDRSRPHHLDWVANHGLWQSKSIQAGYMAADFPSFVAHSYPWASGPELDLLTDFFGWAWLWDDSFDKVSISNGLTQKIAMINEYRNILQGKHSETADSLMMSAFRELLDRINIITSLRWRHRFHTHWEDTFQGVHLEAENMASGITPVLNDYLQLRRDAAGTNVCFDLIEAAGHFEVPPHVHAEPLFLSLRLDAQDIVNMTNDIFSARKEWKDGNTDNIVHVLAHQEQCSWRQASEMAHEIIVSKVESFQRSEDQFTMSAWYGALSRQDQVNTGLFIDGMKFWMRGSLDWHISSPRYK